LHHRRGYSTAHRSLQCQADRTLRLGQTAHIGTYALRRGRLFLVAERTYPPRCRRGEERDPSSWVWEVCSFGRFSQFGYRKPSQLKLPDPPAYASTHGDSDAAAVKQ
ncbi:MAG: hypothetical protein O7F70_04520, partial [Gemmatimonadetes bacterium]|nr:hypothetical protein [Gemmatimonadota bacterium]